MRDEYTLEEGMDIFEIVMTGRYNEYLAMEHAKKQK